MSTYLYSKWLIIGGYEGSFHFWRITVQQILSCSSITPLLPLHANAGVSMARWRICGMWIDRWKRGSSLGSFQIEKLETRIWIIHVPEYWVVELCGPHWQLLVAEKRFEMKEDILLFFALDMKRSCIELKIDVKWKLDVKQVESSNGGPVFDDIPELI